MRTYDFSPLSRSTVGFDRMFDLINNEVPNVQDTYPPYDISRSGEESYRISLALAGFTPEQVTVTAQRNQLTVAAGRKSDNGKQDYIYQRRGLSSVTSASRTMSRSRERGSRTACCRSTWCARCRKP
jgi:molecular chaperone IbpA